jgi:hypothetical protein
MKMMRCFRIPGGGLLAAALSLLTTLAASAQIIILPGQPPSVSIASPTNGSSFTAPADIQVKVNVSDVGDFVRSIGLFDGTNRIAFRLLDPLPGATNGVSIPVFFDWQDVPAGTHVLTATATNTHGQSATSAAVTIQVTNGTSLPVVTVVATDPDASAVTGDPGTFTIYRTGGTSNSLLVFFSLAGTATNGVDYATLSNTVTIPAGAGSVDITVTPLPDPTPERDEFVFLYLRPSPLAMPATYVIGSPSSAIVNIEGTATNEPPKVQIALPGDGAEFPAGANISILAIAPDPDGIVKTVEFFEGTNGLGVVTNNPFQNSITTFWFVWKNVPAGQYTLTAVATDDDGASATSNPVHITVTNFPAVVSIFATDPIAVEGTNCIIFRPPGAFTNFCSGTNTATFLARRVGPTNVDLMVYYSIGGTASNGVDYQTIADNVTIPAGKTFALVTIVPLEDIDPFPHRFDTVILSLKLPPTANPGNTPPYIIGRPARAAAIILEDRDLPGPIPWLLADRCFHVTFPAANGMNYSLQVSTNMVDWEEVCASIVVKGSIQFVDPDACESPQRFYRAVPVAALPFY